MLALIYILLSVAAGAAITTYLPLKVRRSEFLALSIALGLPLAAWVSFILSLLLGYQVGLPLSFAALIIPIIATARSKRRLEVTDAPYTKRYQFLSWGLIALLAVLLGWITVVSFGSWPNKVGDYVSNGNVWADGPLHLSLANQFANGGDKVDLVAPYYNRSALTYPFLPDFYSGMLHRLGLGWSLAFLIPSLLEVGALCVLVFTVGWRLTGSVRAAWIQLLLLIFSGSSAGALFYGWQIVTQGFAPVFNFHLQLGMQMEDMLFNFVQAFLLPQRAFMFGMPLLMVVIILGHWLWNQKSFAASKNGSRS